MQDLVHDRARERLDPLALGLVEPQARRHPLDLARAHRLRPRAQVLDRRHRLERHHPADEALLLFEDDALARERLPAPLLLVRRRDVLQVVDVVEIGIVEGVRVGIDVAGYADVDQEDRAAAALAERALDAVGGEDRTVAADAREHDVRVLEQPIELLEAVRAGPEAHRERLRVGAGPVDDALLAEPLALEREERHLDHLARADHQRALVAELLEDLPREVHGDPRDGDRAVRDARLVLDPLGGRERALEEPREERPAAAVLPGDPERILHLPEDLGLADDHRVDRRCDPEDVGDGLVVPVLVGVVVELGAVRQLIVAAELVVEEALERVARVVDPPGRDDHLHPIAGGDEHRLVDLVPIDELAQRRAVVLHGELLAHLDGRAPMAHADEEDLHVSSSTPTTAKSRKAKPATALAAACREPCRPAKRAAVSPA